MSNAKTYIRFLCIIIVCLKSTLLMSSDYYIPVPEVTTFSPQEVTEEVVFDNKISQDILLMIKENPKVVLLGVTGLGVTIVLAYGMTGALQKMAHDKYKALKKEANEQLAKTGKDLPLKDQILMASLAPFAKGLPKYFSCGQWYMVTAAILLCAGHYFGYQKLGGVGAGVTLAAGHFYQMAAENKRQHEKTQKKIDAVKAQIVSLSAQLDGTKEEIKNEIKNETAKVSVEVKQVGSDVKVVDNKIETLSTKLNDVPATILSLVDKVQGIEVQNETILKQTQDLSGQLTKAIDKFVSTKEQFDSLAEQLTEKMVTIAQETTKQIESIDLKATTYNEHINKLLDDATAKNTILESFQRVQQENGKQLLNLDIKIKELSANDTLKLKSLERIISVHEKSTTDFGRHVKKVNSAHVAFQSSLNSVFNKMHALNKQITAIKAKTDAMEKIIQDNHAELLEKYKKEKKRTKELQQALQDSRSENLENMVTLRRDFQIAFTQVYGELRTIQGQNSETHDILLGQETKLPSNEPVSSALFAPSPRGSLIDPTKSNDQLSSRGSKQGLLAILHKPQSRPGSMRIADTDL